MSTTEENLAIIKKIHEAPDYKESVAQYLADDVEWWADGPKEVLPWAGTFYGPKGKEEWSNRLNSLMEYEQFEIKEYIAQGDNVVVVLFAKGYAKPTKKKFESEIVRIYTLRNGKIVRVRSYYNTAAYVSALRSQ